MGKYGWYLARIYPGDDFFNAPEYVLFRFDAGTRENAALMFNTLTQVANALSTWGGMELHCVTMVILTHLPADGFALSDAQFRDVDNGGLPVYIGGELNLDSIPTECWWASECHALRVMSTEGVYLRGLARGSSQEAETDDLSRLFFPSGYANDQV